MAINNTPVPDNSSQPERASLLKIVGFILLLGSITAICFQSALIAIGL